MVGQFDYSVRNFIVLILVAYLHSSNGLLCKLEELKKFNPTKNPTILGVHICLIIIILALSLLFFSLISIITCKCCCRKRPDKIYHHYSKISKIHRIRTPNSNQPNNTTIPLYEIPPNEEMDDRKYSEISNHVVQSQEISSTNEIEEKVYSELEFKKEKNTVHYETFNGANKPAETEYDLLTDATLTDENESRIPLSPEKTTNDSSHYEVMSSI